MQFRCDGVIHRTTAFQRHSLTRHPFFEEETSKVLAGFFFSHVHWCADWKWERITMYTGVRERWRTGTLTAVTSFTSTMDVPVCVRQHRNREREREGKKMLTQSFCSFSTKLGGNRNGWEQRMSAWADLSHCSDRDKDNESEWGEYLPSEASRCRTRVTNCLPGWSTRS